MGPKSHQGRRARQKPKIIKDKKIRGEWAESVFVSRATEHGLPVSKPWGEMNSFDFVVGRPGRFASVQVKSTTMRFGTGFQCFVRGGHKAYAAGSFDFLAAYVIPEDLWYIVPATVIRGKESMLFYPHSQSAKYEPYREAWHLLREAAGVALEQEGAQDDAACSHENAQSAERVGELRPAPRLPSNALERMEASFNFFRRHIEGNPPRRQGPGDGE